MNFLCIKKIGKLFAFKGTYKVTSSRKQRNPSTLNECLQTPDKPRDYWKPILVISLLFPTIYYLFYYNNEEITSDYGTVTEIATMDQPEVITDNQVIVELVNDEKDPGKALKVVSHVIKHHTDEKNTQLEVTTNLRTCATIISGNVTLYMEVKDFLEDLYPMVKMGGHYIPEDCRVRHKVAILVPYRNRADNLKVFLYNIHPFLMHQRVEYRIFVIEQSGDALFNKGRLFNAGFLEIQKDDRWQCIIFHDVDLLPSNDRILYTCPILPRHMCASVVGRENDPHFRTIFGGVTAMTMWQFKKVNGYSNHYWGWGGEDNDMFKRLEASGIGVNRYKKNFARYVSMNHTQRHRNPKRFQLLKKVESSYKYDGLSSLRYRMVSYAPHHLYTHLVVDVHPPTLPDYVTEGTLAIAL